LPSDSTTFVLTWNPVLDVDTRRSFQTVASITISRRSDESASHESRDRDLRHPRRTGRYRAWNWRNQPRIDSSRPLTDSVVADTEAFAILAGEPALTVLPNLLVGGVLTMIIALALAIWSVAFVQRRGGGLVLFLLLVALLLVGGGFGPSLIGLILGIAALRMHSVPRRTSRRFLWPLARLWPWLVGVGVVAYLGLFPGTVLLYHFAGVANDALVYSLMLISFAALILSLVAARAADQTGGVA
jgi:hypothetical protein